MAYSYAIGDISQNTVLAFSTSIMSIIASVLNFFINKDKEGQVHDIYYYFQLKLKEGRIDDERKKIITARKGIKAELAKKIVKIYTDIDIANFEVGFVTLRKDNFVIRIIQHLHEEDLSNKGGDMK